mgnify:CR=1 FL=1
MLTLYLKQRPAVVTEMFLAVSLERLLSNVGGTLGLWMGASVISILHLFVTLLKAFWHPLKAFSNRAKIEHSSK